MPWLVFAAYHLITPFFLTDSFVESWLRSSTKSGLTGAGSCPKSMISKVILLLVGGDAGLVLLTKLLLLTGFGEIVTFFFGVSTGKCCSFGGSLSLFSCGRFLALEYLALRMSWILLSIKFVSSKWFLTLLYNRSFCAGLVVGISTMFMLALFRFDVSKSLSLNFALL